MVRRRRQSVERQQLVEHLSRLPIEELVAVLRELFNIRIPNPEETSFNHSRFFLGIASSLLESDDGGSEQWGPWELAAVAYPDPAHYTGLGPDWGLCQFGGCMVCGVEARSNVKNGLCSVCGASVYMT